MDKKAFLLIRLKKYLYPHENSCSKVIGILITGKSLHESSSAPQQHKSVQSKWFSLYLHRDVSHTDMLQPHFISCRGVSGAGGNMRGYRNFCQFYLVLSLFYSLKRDFNIPMVLLLRKNYTYTLQRIQRRSIIFLGGGGGGGSNFFQGGGGEGPNANFYRNPYTYLLFSRGSVRTPYPPLDLHMGNVIITGQYLSQSGLYP